MTTQKDERTRTMCVPSTGMQLVCLVLLLAAVVTGTSVSVCQAEDRRRGVVTDKTLVVWAAPADLTQGGGSALTLDDMKSHFDGIIFGEIAPKKWMAGSNFFSRTQKQQGAYPAEDADAKTFVQVAIVYRGRQVTIYRNGEKYAAYEMTSAPQSFGPGSVVMLGRRHVEAGDTKCFAGAIEDARIYDRPLDAKVIASLRPNQPSEPKPWAWWSFENGRADDRMGTFPSTLLTGGAAILDGKLVLDGKDGTMIAADGGQITAWLVERSKASTSAGAIDAARRFRLKMLADSHRPAYHFVIPEGFCMPFDPNGAIFWKGRYHLFYIYQDAGRHYWGHVSSTDLLHWRHHPPALFPAPGDPDRGIFSGNCFVNKKGEATMLYHGVNAGNCIATCAEKDLENWTKLPSNPIIPNPPKGAPYRSWDPHGWLEGKTYYAIFGGQRPAIFKADRLDKWTHVGDLMAHSVGDVSINEDVSCPDLFKLGDKYMLLCISHRLGCRYYLGQWKNEQFHPEFHERMSWVDNAYFAPESLLDDQGRRIMWAWIFDGRTAQTREASGWSGTMGLPRVLSLGADGMLRMRPVEELERLRYNGTKQTDLSVKADSELTLDGVRGNCIELGIEMVADGAKRCGVEVCCSPGGEEKTLVAYDAVNKKLEIDTRKSSLGEGSKNVEAGPLKLEPGESLKLRVFIDKSVVEVFANDRQAVMRRIYPTRKDSVNVALFSEGGAARVGTVEAWDMMPCNPY